MQVVKVIQLQPGVLLHFFEGTLLENMHQTLFFTRTKLTVSADRPGHVTAWFPTTYSANISEFQHGAKALAQYALQHRSEVLLALTTVIQHSQHVMALEAVHFSMALPDTSMHLARLVNINAIVQDVDIKTCLHQMLALQ